MRIRKKKWAEPELEACNYFVGAPEQRRGQWRKNFKNDSSMYLDLGCGKGVFLADAAFERQTVNWIGIDVSIDILGVARRNLAEKYQGKAPENVALVCCRIEDLQNIFGEDDRFERIYINFCNPWPRARAHKKRLTYPTFLTTYRSLLAPEGEIWFKTDNDDLFLASQRYFREADYEIVFQTANLHEERIENILTEHEVMFTKQGIPTKALIAKPKLKSACAEITLAQGKEEK